MYNIGQFEIMLELKFCILDSKIKNTKNKSYEYGNHYSST